MARARSQSSDTSDTVLKEAAHFAYDSLHFVLPHKEQSLYVRKINDRMFWHPTEQALCPIPALGAGTISGHNAPPQLTQRH